MTNISGDVD